MSSVESRLAKLREERLAREKARIEKLRELNLKKYNKSEPQQKPVSNLSSNKSRSDSVANTKSSILNLTNSKNNVSNAVKNNFHVNGTTKRPISVPPLNNKPITKGLPGKSTTNTKITATKIQNGSIVNRTEVKPVNQSNKGTSIPKAIEKKTTIANGNVKEVASMKNAIDNMQPMPRKSFAPKTMTIPKPMPRKSLQPQNNSKLLQPQKLESKTNPNWESVFDRLYKPKVVEKKQTNDAHKLKTDPNYLKKIVKDSGLILNKRHTVFDFKTKVDPPVRRSISAVHFKRISKNEINNCIHKWSSIGEKLDKIHLNDINEDESVNQDKVISAVKSERKKVKFQTPVPFNLNTPRPEELQAKLKSWLQKRGKALDSYHHLQCFGIHHIAQKIKPLPAAPQFDLYDDEDKENIAVENDSDNDSFADNMNDDFMEKMDNNLEDGRDKWRRASYVSDSGDLNDTRDTASSAVGEAVHRVDDVLTGALNDLTDLLKEGFDWEQCARWLRAIRERFPYASDAAAYWECRAALEERRGDLPASVQCWEEAIAKGTEHSVVEANLDQLLDKFMQLKISPNSGKQKRADPKMVDVKNVFKSTIIRFAVQQAKLRGAGDTPRFTATPVRRSGRLSERRTPLQLSMSVRHAAVPGPLVFVPNDRLAGTP